jgi:hypothetical protein
MPRSSLGNVTQGLFILGTALLIFWQPLARQFPLKASDVVFALALSAWLLVRLREGRGPAPDSAGRRLVLPLATLFGSLVVATMVGYVRYDLWMSRDGIILLVRLTVCIALFVAIHHLSHIDAAFVKRISVAFLSPIVLFPAMLVPSLSAPMWVQGRFQGFTVNPNTADVGFSIALAVASVAAIYDARMKRHLRAFAFALIAGGMLMLIVWTQSRAYLGSAFAAIVLGAILTAAHVGLPMLKAVAAAALVFLAVAATGLLLAPRALVNSYVARVSWGTLAPISSDTQSQATSGRQPPSPSAAPAGRQNLARSNWVLTRGQPSFVPGRYGALAGLERLPSGGVRRLMESPHIQAAILYAQLLPANPLGIGVNYEEKFYVDFPWINRLHHGTNSILDIPVYGGVGAVLSVGYVTFLVAKKTRDRLIGGPDETLPYAIGAAASFGGLWIAAILLGSPIFDYQFWIITAIALI